MKKVLSVQKKIALLMSILGPLVLGASIEDLSSEDLKQNDWAKVSPDSVIVDDYAGVSHLDRQWYYSRIGTDRGEMGGGSYTMHIGGGNVTVTVQNGWAGVWTTLMHNARDNDALSPAQLLGPYVKRAYQPHIIGIQVDVLDGRGYLKVELKDAKSRFQEFVQSQGHAAPIYKVINASGPDHDKKFIVEALVDGKPMGKGTGKNKSTAAQAAAENALKEA